MEKLTFEEAKVKMPEIQSELKAKVVEFMQGPDAGYDKEDAEEWSRVDTDIKQSTDYEGNPCTALYFEVGAELGYDEMSELESKLDPIVQKIDPDAFFELYDPGISVCYIWYDNSEIESSQKIIAADLPDYGGAFDIDPHDFWTKEDCMELADEVENILNDDPQVWEPPVKYTDVYETDYNTIIVEVEDNQGNEFSGHAKIDMRRIRTPHDLITKYARPIADDIIQDMNNLYPFEDEIESSINLDSYDDGYVEMRDGEPNFVYNNLRDAQNGVAQSRAGDVEYGMGSHDYKIMRWKDKQLQDVEESEDIENPAVIGEYYDDDDWEEADDVKGRVYIEFDDLIEVYGEGEFDWVDDYKSVYKNADDDSNKWIDDETNKTIIRDSGEAAELAADIFTDYAYTRFPMKPGQYKISGILEIPYTISELYQYISEHGNKYEDDVWEYDENLGDVEFKLEKYVLTNFKTHIVK